MDSDQQTLSSTLTSTAFPVIAAGDENEDLTSNVLELQEGLRALLNRVTTVHAEVDKMKAENTMLQQYIANLMNSKAARPTKASQ